jgi:glycosyltransferase involved in cell wall biosynthesis
MELLYTSTSYLPATGGAQTHAHQLARVLAQKHSLQVVSQWDRNRTDWLLGTTINAPATNLDYVHENIRVHRYGLSTAEKLSLVPFAIAYYPVMPLAIPVIASTIQHKLTQFAQHVDLIHNFRIGREALSYASFKTARIKDIPFVFTPFHHPRWVGWRYKAYLNLYRSADLIFTLTQAELKALLELGVQEQRIVVTGHGPLCAPSADPYRFFKTYRINPPFILFLGQHYEYKGFRQVLQAAPFVWQKVPEANFVFVGPPVGNSEKAFVSQERRIFRLGNVDLQTKTDALAACSLLCVPSTQESFGGVYTEAWNFEKPVIGGNIPAIAEVIDDNVNGMLVQQEPRQIADRIIALLLNESRAQKMGHAGHQKLQQHYTWRQIALKAEQAYQQLLNHS